MTDKPPHARISLLPPSLPPRGLSRLQAVEYIGVGPTKFDDLVADGRMPRPKRIDSRTVWDRAQLDDAFAALDDEATADRGGWENLHQ
jgi:predicted DNA-binding transcriptional regulator AlpA